MNAAFESAISAIDQEVEALDQRRADLVETRDRIAKLAGDDEPAQRRGKKKAAKPKKTATRTTPLGETEDHEPQVLSMLKRSGGVMRPGELAHELGVEPATLRAWLKPMVKAKTVVVTGTTMSRRVSLPGKVPAGRDL